MKNVQTIGKPIKLWLDDLEDGAMQQANHLAQLPSLHKHVAIMPDAHQGYGMPIGGVIALKDTVIPNAVGVDIGCGMLAVKTDIRDFTKNGLETLRHEILDLIPVGFNHLKEPVPVEKMPELHNEVPLPVRVEFENARSQLGTLGGGNHFIEIQADEEGWYWLMIHSGSRNLGYKVAKYYNEVAKSVHQHDETVRPAWDLASFNKFEHPNLYEDYFHAMEYCVDFALANRVAMLYKIQNMVGFNTKSFTNIAHNYAVEEEHFGEKVIVHRKGATLASKGTRGIIPGSMGTKSYIVEGRGSAAAFESCSHGAGRTMSRTRAKKDLCLYDELGKMGSIIHGMTSEKYLDEAVGAYKDIDIVMENQKDLVKIVTTLRPLVSIKG